MQTRLVLGKTRQQAAEDVVALYREIQSATPHLDNDIVAFLTIAAAIYVTAHPIYITEYKNAVETSAGE